MHDSVPRGAPTVDVGENSRAHVDNSKPVLQHAILCNLSLAANDHKQAC